MPELVVRPQKIKVFGRPVAGELAGVDRNTGVRRRHSDLRGIVVRITLIICSSSVDDAGRSVRIPLITDAIKILQMLRVKRICQDLIIRGAAERDIILEDLPCCTIRILICFLQRETVSKSV